MCTTNSLYMLMCATPRSIQYCTGDYLNRTSPILYCTTNTLYCTEICVLQNTMSAQYTKISVLYTDGVDSTGWCVLHKGVSILYTETSVLYNTSSVQHRTVYTTEKLLCVLQASVCYTKEYPVLYS